MQSGELGGEWMQVWACVYIGMYIHVVKAVGGRR